jgi:hypothetical protein
MKKIILFLLPLFALAQNPTNFPYGIKNTAATTDSTPAYFVTTQVDGVHKKTPAATIALKTDLDLKQTVFTGICQKQYLTENDIVIDNTALTLTIATVKNGTAISPANPVRFFTDGSGIAVMHEKTAPVVFNFTNTTGVWYFYFNSSGAPIATQTVWNDFSTIATVYRFYWNATLSTANKRVIESVEYHKNDISWASHTLAHLDGTKWANGLDISSNAISTGTPNPNGSNAVISLSSGTNIDDNLLYTITNAQTGTTKFTQDLGTGLLPATSGKFITITNNTGGLLDKIPSTDFPFLWNATTNTPEYLTVNGTRTGVTANYFFVYYVYSLQDPRRGETIKIKSAETDFANITLANAHNWEQLQALFPTLRDGEIRLMYKLTFEYKTAFDVGTKKTALRFIDDLRKQKTTTTAVASGIVPATSVSVSPVGGIASTNAQSALQELDSEKANDINVIHTNSIPETKIGGLTLGTNLANPNDKWIAFGTSVTDMGYYTSPTSAQLNLTIMNYGVSGSTSNDLVNHYSEIPTWTNEYRLVSFEYGINDSAQSILLSTFRTNLENAITNAKNKGWSNDRIIVIASNYCTNSPMITTLETYTNEAILIAKQQGVQYYDAYNYTKNNGGGSLLSDGVHPTVAGGLVYARGLIASMQGGMEVTNGLTIDNGLVVNGIVNTTKQITTLGSVKTGNGENNNPANTVTGDVIMPFSAGITSQYSQAGIISRITPIEYAEGTLSSTYRNYTENGEHLFYVSGSTRGNQNLAMRIKSTGVAEMPLGFKTGGELNIAYEKAIINNDAGWTSKFLLGQSGGDTSIYNGYSAGKFNIYVTNGITNSENLGFQIQNNRDFHLYGNGIVDGNISMDFTKYIQYSAGWTNRLTLSEASGNTSLNNGYSSGTIDFNVSNGSTNGSNLALRINNNKSTRLYGDLQVDGNITSPTLTGTPTAPTATAGTNTMQIATTAFVQTTTNNNAVLLTGNQTVTGTKTFNKTGDSPNIISNNTVLSYGIESRNTGFGVGVYSENSGGGVGVYSENSGGGDGITSNGTTSSSGYIYAGRNNGAYSFTVTKDGNVSMNSLISNGTIRLKNYTVATLPTGTQGDTAYVTDATAPTYLGTLTGGGSVVCPVFYNGTAWVAH